MADFFGGKFYDGYEFFEHYYGTYFYGAAFFNGGFFSPEAPPPTVEAAAPIIGGWPHPLSLPPNIPSVAKRRRDFRKRLGLDDEAIEVIAQVAARQVENLGLDEAQRTEELYRELETVNLPLKKSHLQALNEMRERLIEEEIGTRLRAKLDEEEAMLLIALATLSSQLT